MVGAVVAAGDPAAAVPAVALEPAQGLAVALEPAQVRAQAVEPASAVLQVPVAVLGSVLVLVGAVVGRLERRQGAAPAPAVVQESAARASVATASRRPVARRPA